GPTAAPSLQMESVRPLPQPHVQPQAEEAPLPEQPPPTSGRTSGAHEVALPVQTGRRAPRERAPHKPSAAPRVFFVLLLLVLAGGGALQLTKHGAFGHLTIGDYLHAKDYASFATTQSASARARV